MSMLWKLLGAIVVVIALLIGAVFVIPADRLGGIVSDQLSKQLGRSVTLGDVKLSVYPVLGVEVTQLEIANAAWSQSGPMMTADTARIGVDAMAALTGTIKIRAIDADTPQILLQRDGQGRANWDFGDGTTANTTSSGNASSRTAVTVAKVTVTNGAVRYEDANAAPIAVRDLNLEVSWPDQNGPAQIDATFSPFSDAVTLKAILAQPSLSMAGRVSNLDLNLSTAGGQISFEGAFGIAPELSGAFTADIANSGRFAKALGQSGVEIPKGLGQSVKGKGAITLTKSGNLALRDTVLTLDSNTISLAADVALGDVPRVNAQIDAKSLDFASLLASEGTGSSGGDAGWSTAPIDASALSLLNGEIAIRTGSLDLGDLKIGATRSLLSIDRARAVFEIHELAAYEGSVTGQFVANNRNGLSVGGNLAISSVALEPLLNDSMGLKRLSGDASISVKFLGVGQSVAAIMSSLSGDGSVSAGPGVISGLDLNSLFNGGDPSGGTTVFDVLTGSFAMKSGVLRNSDLAMSTGRLKASGNGKVSLGGKSIDYLLTASDPQARGGRGFAIPVRVKGPWSAPTIRADAGELIDQNFAEEKKELENKVRDKVNDKLEEKLGVRVEEGQSLEDTVKKKVEEEVGKKLLELLGR